MSLALERKLPLILLLALLMLAAIGFFSYRSTQSLKEAVNWQSHTQGVLIKLNETLNSVLDVETGGRGFALTGNETFLEPYQKSRQKVFDDLGLLKSMIADNPKQIENFTVLAANINERIAASENFVEIRRTDGLLGAANEISKGKGKAIMDNIRLNIEQMKNEELRLLKLRQDNLQTTLNNNFWMIVFSTIIGTGLLAFANFVVINEIKKRRLAESGLVEANADLERRVEERTAELEKANENLRESELFKRSVIDSLAAHIAVLDREGKIILVNNAWENFAEANAGIEQLGKTSIGQNYLSVCREEDSGGNLNDVVKNLQAILNGEQHHFTVEYPCHSPTEERWFLMQVNALQASEGGVVVSHYNITDRVKAEGNERNARREAEIATRLRDEFMAMVSHELRTPLNAILGWARIIKSGKVNKEMESKAVDTIIKNAETQNRLIEDLMDVSRVMSGKLVLEFETVNPEELVTNSVEAVQPSAADKFISLNLDIDENVKEKTISGDPNRLRQVVLNLLTNAIKFTPESGKIDVELTAEDQWIVVKIKDNGAGISQEFLPFVFERFRQDAANIKKSGGLGLGLAIVRHLTELHGGTVSVESKGENKGATFTVKFPIKQD